MPTEHSRIDPMSWPTHSLQEVYPSFPSAIPPGLLLSRSWLNVFADNDGLANGEGPQLRPTSRRRPADSFRRIRGERGKGGQKGSGWHGMKEPRPLGGPWEEGRLLPKSRARWPQLELTECLTSPRKQSQRAASVSGRKRTRKKKTSLAYEMRQQRKREFEVWHGT